MQSYSISKIIFKTILMCLTYFTGNAQTCEICKDSIELTKSVQYLNGQKIVCNSIGLANIDSFIQVKRIKFMAVNYGSKELNCQKVNIKKVLRTLNKLSDSCTHPYKFRYFFPAIATLKNGQKKYCIAYDMADRVKNRCTKDCPAIIIVIDIRNGKILKMQRYKMKPSILDVAR